MNIIENHWKSLEITRNQWKSLDINYWKSLQIIGNQWKSLEIIGNHWKLMKIIGHKSLEINENHWTSLEINENHWKSLHNQASTKVINGDYQAWRRAISVGSMGKPELSHWEDWYVQIMQGTAGSYFSLKIVGNTMRDLRNTHGEANYYKLLLNQCLVFVIFVDIQIGQSLSSLCLLNNLIFSPLMTEGFTFSNAASICWTWRLPGRICISAANKPKSWRESNGVWERLGSLGSYVGFVGFVGHGSLW